MSEKIVAVALDINKIPYIDNPEIIFTLGDQKIWYTTNVQPILIPRSVKYSDALINAFLEKFVKKSTKRNILTLNYFTRHVAIELKKINYDKIIFESKVLKSKILPNFKNKNEYVINDSFV